MDQNRKNPVRLRLYDLSKGLAALHSEKLLGIKIDAIWHTSLEVFGKEIYFQNGIVQSVPGVYGTPLKIIDYGHTEITEDILDAYILELNDKYNANTYHLFMNNCNHFSDELLTVLTGQNIPEEVRNLPELVMKNPAFGMWLGMMNNQQGKQEQ